MKVSLQSSELTLLTWRQPVDVGGCPILSYQVMVDDGAHGNFTLYELLSSSTFSIEVKELTYTKSYRFMIIATNDIGTRDSNIVRAVCADLPETPMIAPTFL